MQVLFLVSAIIGYTELCLAVNSFTSDGDDGVDHRQEGSNGTNASTTAVAIPMMLSGHNTEEMHCELYQEEGYEDHG